MLFKLLRTDQFQFFCYDLFNFTFNSYSCYPVLTLPMRVWLLCVNQFYYVISMTINRFYFELSPLNQDIYVCSIDIMHQKELEPLLSQVQESRFYFDCCLHWADSLTALRWFDKFKIASFTHWLIEIAI